MKRIKIIIALICMVFQSAIALADGWDFDVSKYPSVSFEYNIFSRDTLKASEFQIVEDGAKCKVLRVSALVKKGGTAAKDVCIAIVWDVYSTEPVNMEKGQTYIGQLLQRLENVSQVKDVSVMIHLPSDQLYNIAGKNKTEIKEVVNDFTASNTENNYEQGKIQDAVEAGLKELSQKEIPGMLLLYTSGNSLTPDIKNQIPTARKARIPIYIVSPREEVQHLSYLAERLATETFGAVFDANGGTPNSLEPLINEINFVPRLYQGQTYTVTFKSPQDRNGKRRVVALTTRTDGMVANLNYDAPSYTLGYWISCHVWWFIVILLLTVAVLGTGGFFLFRRIKNGRKARKEAAEAAIREKKELAARQDELNRRLIQSQQEQQQIQSDARKRHESAMQETQRKTLSELLRSKRLAARISFQDVDSMADTEPYVIRDAVTTIGSAEDNDITLPFKIISRHHAEIYFNGTNFEIIDNYSTNGLKVNGCKVGKATLKNGDVIILGNIPIRFYM